MGLQYVYNNINTSIQPNIWGRKLEFKHHQHTLSICLILWVIARRYTVWADLTSKHHLWREILQLDNLIIAELQKMKDSHTELGKMAVTPRNDWLRSRTVTLSCWKRHLRLATWFIAPELKALLSELLTTPKCGHAWKNTLWTGKIFYQVAGDWNDTHGQ